MKQGIAERVINEELAERFDALAREAQACRVCARMAERTAVLSELNGSLRPKALLVAEAPGRQGADRTRTPFSGDASGRAFDHLMASVGLTRDDIFITNAVLCSPRSDTGANRAPTQAEVRACNGYLRRVIDLLDPPVVVAIGATALAALGRIEPHGLALGRDVATAAPWYGRTLIPLYHPSPQVLVSRRNLEEQTADWQALGALLNGEKPLSHE